MAWDDAMGNGGNLQIWYVVYGYKIASNVINGVFAVILPQ